MNRKFLLRNFFETKFGFLIFPICFISSYTFRFDYSGLKDYKFLFSNIIAIVAITLGFLTTLIFQLWSLNNSSIICTFKRLNLLKKLYFYEKTSVISCILTIIASIIIPLYFDLDASKYTLILTSFFNSILIYSLYCVSRFSLIFKSITDYMKYESSEQIEYTNAVLPDKKNNNVADDNYEANSDYIKATLPKRNKKNEVL